MRGSRRRIERRWKQDTSDRLENNIVEARRRRMDIDSGHPGSSVSQRYAELNVDMCAK